MKIQYIHGFGSKYNPESEKIKALRGLGEVVGMSYDYTDFPFNITSKLTLFALAEKVDLIVGTSLGAWFAAEVAGFLGIPAVLINPAIDPHIKLKKYENQKLTDWYGNEYEIDPKVVKSYLMMNTDVEALVLLDKGDTVIHHRDIDKLNHHFEVYRFKGGSHQFEHMIESLPLIMKFYENHQYRI